MKTYLHYWLTLVLVLQASFALATGQRTDIIYINGEKWGLFALPLEEDPLVQEKLKTILPKDRSIATNNWVGYTACWTLHEDVLYLQQIQIPMYDKQTKRSYTEYLMLDTLKEIFPSYATKFGIEARWFNRQVRAGRGNIIRYEHDGFNRNMEQEYILSFENGKLTNKRLYDNKVLLKNNMSELENSVFNAFLPTMSKDNTIGNNYRHVQMNKNEFTQDGYLNDCELYFTYKKKGSDELHVIKDQQNEYIIELKQILKKQFVQNRYYINGQYIEEETKRFEFDF